MGLDKQIGERDPYIMASQPGVSAPRADVRRKSGGVTHVSGSNKKFEIWCPQRLSQIWILINNDGSVSHQLGLTKGYRVRTRLGTPCYTVAVWNSLFLDLPCIPSVQTFKQYLRTELLHMLSFPRCLCFYSFFYFPSLIVCNFISVMLLTS